MTEDEAKTKACFKAATFGASQQLADGPGPHCIGSACMAWRWIAPSNGETKIEAIKRYRSEHYTDLITAKYFVENNPHYIRTEQPIQGYCGLAGSV